MLTYPPTPSSLSPPLPTPRTHYWFLKAPPPSLSSLARTIRSAKRPLPPLAPAPSHALFGRSNPPPPPGAARPLRAFLTACPTQFVARLPFHSVPLPDLGMPPSNAPAPTRLVHTCSFLCLRDTLDPSLVWIGRDPASPSHCCFLTRLGVFVCACAVCDARSVCSARVACVCAPCALPGAPCICPPPPPLLRPHNRQIEVACAEPPDVWCHRSWGPTCGGHHQIGVSGPPPLRLRH